MSRKSPLCKHCLLCFPKINVFPEQNYFRCTPFSMKLNLQDISSHIQQRTFLSKYPNKKSSDRQAFSIFHIEESLYLNYNEDSISPPNQVSCCIKPSIMLYKTKHHAGIESFLLCPNRDSTILTSPSFDYIIKLLYITFKCVHISLTEKKKQNKKKKTFPLTPIPYGNSSK